MATATHTVADLDLTTATPRLHHRWPLFGLAAGVGGFAANGFLWHWVAGDVKSQGAEAIVAELAPHRTLFLIGQSVGWLTLFLFVAFAVGFTRFVARRAPQGSTLPAFAQLGVIAAAGALTITMGLRSIVAGGLPGAIDAAMYTATDVAVLHLLTDQLQWVSWMGVVLAAGVTAVLALRHRAAPRAIGVVSALLTAAVLGMTLVLGLPYSAGIAGPIWLVIASLGLLRTARTA